MERNIPKEIANFAREYQAIYINGTYDLLEKPWAYLVFGCVFSGMEVLAGYCFPEEKQNGQRFKAFIRTYCSDVYHALAGDLWDLRNSVTHSFSPRKFALCHGRPNEHLSFTTFSAASTDKPPLRLQILNADNMQAELREAFAKYALALQVNAGVQLAFHRRLTAVDGGGLYVRQNASSSANPAAV